MKFRFTRAMSRRAACIGLSVAMCATFAAGQLTAFAAKGGSDLSASASDIYGLDFENANGKVDLTQIKIDNMSKDVIQNDGVTSDVYSLTRTVIVTLQGKPLSERSYTGKSAQLEIAEEQQAFLSELKSAGINYEFRSSYSSIANAVAIDVKLSTLSQIKSLKGVNTVSVGSTYARPKAIETSDGAQKNDSNIYGTGIYNSSAWVEKGYDGSGMTVAVLDTGLDYTHEAFRSDPLEDNNEISFTYDYVDDKINNATAANATDPVPFQSLKSIGASTDDVYISKKVPFAFDYADRDTDVFPSYSQHGTHVAGIVAGKASFYTDKDGNIPTAEDEDGNTYNIPFRGVAPEAQLVICKVFTDDLESEDLGGADAVDILDALEDCYNLNVDVINMSLGTSAGFSSRALCPSGMKEEDEEGYLMKSVYERVRNKGISLIVAASNDYSAGYGSAFGTNLTSNPDSGTVGSPSTFTGALSVASINGQYSPYLLANAYDTAGNAIGAGEAIYFEESRNEDSDPYDFVGEMLGDNESGTFRYVVIPGTGETTDYMPHIKRLLRPQYEGEKVIAVVKRGNSQFKDKISTAMNVTDRIDGVTTDIGAAAVIVYNNVSGLIRMSLGDMRDRVPAISVSLDAGLALTGNGTITSGYLTINKKYTAGPFMNDYSSWGATPDLKLKPDVTAHGGEITSAVAGGYYDEMSGTSMACPNLAGFEAIFKSYLKNNQSVASLWQNPADEDPYGDALRLTQLTNNIIMSTAATVYDQNKLPYSPRKQGAGLATLDNVFNTKAYLYTKEEDGMCEDGRPKAELGDDSKRNGVYNVKFYVKNFGDTSLTFKTNSIFMTETVGKDGLSVAEKAYLLNSNAQWKIAGSNVTKDGGSFTVAAGAEVAIEVTLKLTDEEKQYLNTNFKNGMFVEGFLQLISSDGTQCNLNLPFMGFYGDWKDAPMMDLTCFDVAKDAKNTALKDEDRAQPRVWATQPYGYYAGENYTIPLGSFLYIQDEAKEHTAEYVYVEEDHIAISRDFGEYYGDNDPSNYLTTTGIKALYAGLLRNAEVVTYTLTNVDTGEILKDENDNEVRVIYRANKSYAGGGSGMPSQVLLELKPDEIGLAANGKYRLDFSFYFDYKDYEAYTNGDQNAFKNENGETYGVYKDNTFSMNFYVDYEAPVLVDSRIRFQNMQDESGKAYQNVYLDLDVFDNHYPQAVVLCYAETEGASAEQVTQIKLATDYVTPILNPRRNTINTVSIDITEFYEEYRGKVWVEIDDYALNHNTYYLDLNYTRTTSNVPGDFTLLYDGDEVTENQIINIEKNTAFKFAIESSDTTKTNWDMSNFGWSTANPNVAKVKNGEVFAAGKGTTMLTVTGGLDENGRTVTRTVILNVTDEQNLTLENVTVKATFGAVANDNEALHKAEGFLEVSSGQKFKLTPVLDPWYYPSDKLVWTWETTNENLATVDQNGNVEAVYEGEYSESVTITARTRDGFGKEITAEVVLSIQPPFTTTGMALTKYRGRGGELKDSVTVGGETFNNVRVLTFPEDMTVTSIGEEAFKDCEGVEIVIIPKSVTTIDKRAFEGCVNLKAICFVQLEAQAIPDSSLTLINTDAFTGCTSLKVVDLTNCKLITVGRSAFADCTELKEVVNMAAIGTAYDRVFAGCTSLESADVTRLHVASAYIFDGCTSLTEVKIGADSALGTYMFRGCTSLQSVEIGCPTITAGAFAGCSDLKTVTTTYNGDSAVTIGARAFENCSSLTDFNINGKQVSSVGDFAFRNCTHLSSLYASADFNPVLGSGVFDGVLSVARGGAVIKDGTLVVAPATVDADFAALLASGAVTAIGPNAFTASRMSAGVTVLDLSKVTSIGRGAFRGLNGLVQVTLNESLTQIPAYAFCECADLAEINIPDGVTKIGDYAFYGCSSLAATNINDLADLESIGTGAFRGTAITSLNLPAKLQTIGDEAFARCEKLAEVTINSVKTMGSRVFALCPALTTAVFGDNAESTGNYTFSTVEFGYNLSAGSFGVTEYRASALTSVEFGGKIVRIGEGVFAYTQLTSDEYVDGCNKLTAIDLNNVREIGAYAFAGCTALGTVTGIENVTKIESYAFENCTSLTELDLSAAVEIHACVFQMSSKLGKVTLGDKLEGIGDYAFFGTAIEKAVIPASCTYIGKSAFGWNDKLTAIEVAEGNEKYFDDGGVLYRYIDKAKKVYELTAYPAGKVAEIKDGMKTYSVLEGTATLLDYSFAYVKVDRVYRVIMPYTLKSVGHGAFFDSTINTYTFESIEAPALLQGVMKKPLSSDEYSSNSFFYTNFGGHNYLINSIKKYPSDTPTGTRTIHIVYPSNGSGYDNYIYNGFFGANRTQLSEMPEDSTRELLSIINGFEYDAATVRTWRKGNVADETVAAFAETVKYAHGLYNGLRTDTQLSYVGEAAVNKLFEIENALKTVKPQFGLQPAVSDVEIDLASSTHRTAYRPGSRFSLSGVKILVTYDDHTTEVVNASGNFRLSARHDRELKDYDTFVTLEGVGKFEGKTADVAITVSEDAPEYSEEKDGLSAGVIAAIVIVVVAVVAAAAVAVLIVLKKRGIVKFGAEKKAKTDDGDDEVYNDADYAGEDEKKATEEVDGESENNQEENSGEDKTDD